MPKSTKKRLLLRIETVLKRLSKDLELDPHDLAYVLARTRAEGPSFVTKTLPQFAKYALACVQAGRFLTVAESGFTHFQWRRGAPVFMAGLLSEALSSTADAAKTATALARIRQFCEYFYKTCFGFEQSTLRAAENRYLTTDEQLCEPNKEWADTARRVFLNLFPLSARLLPHDLFSDGTRDGPGSFAGSESVASWGLTYEQYKRLPGHVIGSCRADLAGYAGYFKSYPSSPERVNLAREGKVADLRFVSKDSRGPRVISKEPYLLLKAQMAFQDKWVKILEKESRNRINFRDQSVNQELCRRASIDGKAATIDLKDASDRVSLSLVRTIFRDCPGLRFMVRNLRSTHVRLPSGRVHRLKKFANMGSGTCFPVLSVVVFLAATIGVARSLAIPYQDASRLVYVYGDDLICPTRCAMEVRTSLEQAGLLVNQDKSYTRGPFRESCGADYMRGYAVGPVRLTLRSAGLAPVRDYRNGVVPIDTDGSVLQLERHCRELVDHGLDNLATYYYGILERRLGDLPKVARLSPALGRYSLGEIPTLASREAYVPRSVHKFTSGACPYKGIGQALKASDGLGTDWNLIPLRYQIVLKKTVLEGASFAMYGLPDWVPSA